MSPLRRVAVPLRLAAVRARSAPGATALAALGIAAAAAMLAAVLGASLVARDRSLARALDEVPTAQRSVRAAWFGVPGPGAVTWPELDRQARASLPQLRVAPTAGRQRHPRVGLSLIHISEPT